ncbi:dihydrodipicolinate reductase [Solimonas sp. K1W22B-7]|uniref:NAD(P)H-dependent amine dehydrogenase family protein n=1 Tax=Solimonas sp. K1W22B-7 TaxID=2303331 RepID=UPI000E330B8B|nr:dihydrodipicolinate reductase [Solimonas sp. K1W22B-7]AXQ29797.1 dihydrodipicolinate reductase [Solimonas sp. K1W22B-7]
MTHPARPIRVVQWSTGVVGKPAVKAIVAHPLLELVGCWCHSPDKVGKDVGELCGMAPLGIRATDDVGALLALQPDVVCYMPQFPKVDEMEKILAAGCDIVSTAYFITGTQFGKDEVARLRTAALKGGSTIYGGGVNPGHANVIALVASAGCARIDKISVLESVDATPYESAGTWEAIGFGLPVDDPVAPPLAERAMPSFKEAVEMMAEALKIEVDEIRFDVEYAAATEDVDLGYMRIGKGCISGLRCCWSARVNGKAVIELKVAWKLGTKLEPNWAVEDGWLVEIQGQPNIRCLYQQTGGTRDFDPGTLTAMPMIHAIPHVFAAPPGIIRAHQLPLVTGAYTVGT